MKTTGEEKLLLNINEYDDLTTFLIAKFITKIFTYLWVKWVCHGDNVSFFYELIVLLHSTQCNCLLIYATKYMLGNINFYVSPDLHSYNFCILWLHRMRDECSWNLAVKTRAWLEYKHESFIWQNAGSYHG